MSVELNVRCADEFSEDARLLRAGRPAVRVVTIGEAALSYGVGEREDAGYLARARSEGLATGRRSTGGSGVLHLPGDLAWSVVLPRTDPRVGRDFARAYSRLGSALPRFLANIGISARWEPSAAVERGYCILSGRGEVLTVGGRALGGAAQHLTRTALLHQGMVALEVPRDRIASLFGVPPSELVARITGLRELGVDAAPDRLAHELATELAGEFGIVERVGAGSG